MQSMPTIIKAKQSIETNSFQLHYFPDIPFECEFPDQGKQPEGSPFEHIDFSAVDPTCGLASEHKRTNGQQTAASGLLVEQDTQAYEAGLQKGCDEGYQAGLQQAAASLANLGQVAMELEHLKQDLYQRAEQDIVDLALAVSKKILDQEITTNRQAITGVVKAALKRVSDHSQIAIRINPADLQTVKQAEPRLAEYFENSSGVSYETDESIGPGGCIIETNFGEIDARLDQQFAVIAEALRSDPTNGQVS
jgi:flagellar assembly protein FliH